MRETKTIQLYPDDGEINNTVSLYENFGWEVVSNQRCQELIDGGTRTSTFNKLTISRDKDAKWYRDVKDLEDEYDRTLGEIENLKSQKIYPHQPTKPEKPGIGSLILAIVMIFMPPLTIGSILIFISRGKYKGEYKKYLTDMDRYNAELPAAAKTNAEIDKRITTEKNRLAGIRAAAENAIANA